MDLKDFEFLLQLYQKNIDLGLGIAASSDHCVIAVESFNLTTKDPNITMETNFKDKNYQLLICNSIGTTVDCTVVWKKKLRRMPNAIINFFIFAAKYTDMKPNYVAMNSHYVIVASKDHFMLWQYHTPKVCIIK